VKQIPGHGVLWNALCRVLAPSASLHVRRARPRVHACLIYHGITAPGDTPAFDDDVQTPVATLTRHLELLLGLGATPTTIDEIAATVARNEPLPPFSASITFDDAYANVAANALPVLSAHGFAATIFAPVDYIGTDRLLWNDRVHALIAGDPDLVRRAAEAAGIGPVSSTTALVYALKDVPDATRRETIDRLGDWSGLPGDTAPGGSRICSEAELADLQERGWSVGSHTLSHPMLTRLSEEDARREIAGSRERLAEMLGAPPRGFAYPNGEFGESHMRMVSDAGYEYAVTTEGALTGASQDPVALSRIYPKAHEARFTCLVTGFEQRARAMLGR